MICALCVAAGCSEDGLPRSSGGRGGGEHDQTLQCFHQVRRLHVGDQSNGGRFLWCRYEHACTIYHTSKVNLWQHQEMHKNQKFVLNHFYARLKKGIMIIIAQISATDFFLPESWTIRFELMCSFLMRVFHSFHICCSRMNLLVLLVQSWAKWSLEARQANSSLGETLGHHLVFQQDTIQKHLLK